MTSSICALLSGKNAVASKTDDLSWETATWKGSRRVQLRAALAMTLRERFQALEELTELAQRLVSMPRNSPRTVKKSPVAP